MKKIIIGSSLVLSIVSLILGYYNSKKYTLVFIDNGKVYSEFQLSKELNKQYENVVNARKHILDSLMEMGRVKTNELRFKKQQTEEDVLAVKKLEEEYIYKVQQFEKENRETQLSLNNRIWAQLNQFVGDYGRKNNYSFIYGATGEGSIMFADKALNVTDEVVEYVNNRFNDKKSK